MWASIVMIFSLVSFMILKINGLKWTILPFNVDIYVICPLGITMSGMILDPKYCFLGKANRHFGDNLTNLKTFSNCF